MGIDFYEILDTLSNENGILFSNEGQSEPKSECKYGKYEPKKLKKLTDL